MTSDTAKDERDNNSPNNPVLEDIVELSPLTAAIASHIDKYPEENLPKMYIGTAEDRNVFRPGGEAYLLDDEGGCL